MLTYLNDGACQVGVILLYVQRLGPSSLLFLQNLNELRCHPLLKTTNKMEITMGCPTQILYEHVETVSRALTILMQSFSSLSTVS